MKLNMAAERERRSPVVPGPRKEEVKAEQEAGTNNDGSFVDREKVRMSWSVVVGIMSHVV